MNIGQSGITTGLSGLSNTITLGNITGAAGSSGAWSINLFGDESEPHVKKYEVFEITEDILVLSVVWQRMRKERAQSMQDSSIPFPIRLVPSPTSMTDKILFDNITNDDRARAESIRDYYSKKLMLWSLNDIKLTNFRQDMKKLIQSDGKIFQENMKPLAYRLPEFHDYDVQFDEMFIQHNTQVKQERQKQIKQKKLSLVNTVVRKRKYTTTKEYWFSDEQDNLNIISVNKDNSLISLLDLHTKNPFMVSALSCKQIRDNREYCVLEKYSFL